ncbi:Mannan endo-1-6-alpha-mannosidase DCW1 [Penicillium paradoxum]|uniref:Mannan endo-1-6-alpha-mannosidase DCW1 n=1 Tax=Penicillium paradoxum TaxID=176176 RepID=UPI002546BD65|nr:Mannan endo-1-6-alpha-mannosidase DCW1 [Penicillium paradoxum]KAJ5779934.1 Mannan endo-1-6-alpha-mannosidase DCW1 [Penicillium paradoxum]
MLPNSSQSILSKLWLLSTCITFLVSHTTAAGIAVDFGSPDSIKSAASTVAYDLLSFYSGNNTGDTPGNLPDPYYWWEAGAFFGALINYWSYTGDESYNDVILQAMVHQAGVKGDFMPKNQTYTEGNDDQCFWALSAMIAAERNFPSPPDTTPDWLAMVQAVFNGQAHRWHSATCGGGLKWQIYSWNAGYFYKNSISNGCFFDISSRLARYTGNKTYAEWATKAWNWSQDIGLVGPNYEIFDGTTETDNCTSHDHNRWTYNAGVWLHGASVMYNWTSSISEDTSNTSAVWQARTDGLLKATDHFFSKKNIMYEPLCEFINKCNVDQLSFKGYLSRWLAEVTQYAPYTYDTIMSTKLRPTAEAAVAQCQGGDTGTFCGFRWSSGKYDGRTGVGEQMGVLEVLQGLLAADVGGPLTSSTGGSSVGNSAAGTDEEDTSADTPTKHIGNGDKAGAAILTFCFVSLIGGAVYMMIS